ncbi:MAG: hypothetical protein ABGZ24_23490 [Fuerstiella sp.]
MQHLSANVWRPWHSVSNIAEFDRFCLDHQRGPASLSGFSSYGLLRQGDKTGKRNCHVESPGIRMFVRIIALTSDSFDTAVTNYVRGRFTHELASSRQVDVGEGR